MHDKIKLKLNKTKWKSKEFKKYFIFVMSKDEKRKENTDKMGKILLMCMRKTTKKFRVESLYYIRRKKLQISLLRALSSHTTTLAS